MSALLVILIGTVLVNTFLLMQEDETLGGSRQRGSIANAMRIAAATSVVLVVAGVASSALWNLFTPLPGDTLLFVYALTVVAITVLLHRLARRRMPRLERALASSPLLVISNSLALGTVLLGTMSDGNAYSILYVGSLAIAFIAALTLFVALVSRIVASEVPMAFRNAPITLISAGLLTLALMGFTGLLRG